MKHYINNTTGQIFAFEEDGTQDSLITKDMTSISIEEVYSILNPPEKIEAYELQSKINEAKKYLSDTDYKMTIDYFATLTKELQDELIRLRSEAREFVRNNE